MVNFVQMGETLPVSHRKQLGLGQQLLGQSVFANMAFFDEPGWRALKNLIQAPVPEHNRTTR